MVKGELTTIFKIASIYIATIIGAGFASGQEIIRFFTLYESKSIIGIIFAGILFSIIGGIVLEKISRERINDYNELVFPILGWFMGWVAQIIVTLFFLVLFCVMIAGCGTIIHDKFNIPFYAGIAIMASICFFIMMYGIRGVAAISTIVTPIVISGMMIVSFYILITKDSSVFSPQLFFQNITNNWFASAIVYVSYNSLMAMVVLSGTLPLIRTKRSGVIGGIAGGAIFCVITMIVNAAVLIFTPRILSSELPVLNIVEKYCSDVGRMYIIILWLAMFLSAAMSGSCFVDRVVSITKVDRKLFVLLFCGLAIPFSSIGFSTLISIFYPLFGYLGLFLIVAIILDGIKSKSA